MFIVHGKNEFMYQSVRHCISQILSPFSNLDMQFGVNVMSTTVSL
jgi:hypothetical protein